MKEGKRVTVDEFSENVANQSGIEKDKAKKFVKTLFQRIGSHLTDEEQVRIYQFGTFKKKWAEEREGINPQNQEKIMIAAHHKIQFKPASLLANEVNKKYRHLKPNVLDQLLTLTGMTKMNPDITRAFQKDEQLKKDFSQAKKRALITLIVLALFLLLLLAAIIFIPVYANEQLKIVKFVTRVNHMLGFEKLSDRLRSNQNETIDSEKASQFIMDARQNLATERDVIDTYSVRRGDSIFSIAKQYWQNEYLWPDLYILNQTEFSDPDIIHPGDKILIYEKLGDPRSFSRKQRDHIVQAYIGIYRIYRALGEKDMRDGKKSKGEKRIDDARWTLYTAVRYDHKLLKKYRKAIYPEDIQLIETYVKRFGFQGKEKLD